MFLLEKLGKWRSNSKIWSRFSSIRTKDENKRFSFFFFCKIFFFVLLCLIFVCWKLIVNAQLNFQLIFLNQWRNEKQLEMISSFGRAKKKKRKSLRQLNNDEANGKSDVNSFFSLFLNDNSRLWKLIVAFINNEKRNLHGKKKKRKSNEWILICQ